MYNCGKIIFQIEATVTKLSGYANEILEDSDSASSDEPVALTKLMEIYRMMRFSDQYPGLLDDYDHQNFETNEPKRFKNFVQNLVKLIGINLDNDAVENFFTFSDIRERFLETGAKDIY